MLLFLQITARKLTLRPLVPNCNSRWLCKTEQRRGPFVCQCSTRHHSREDVSNVAKCLEQYWLKPKGNDTEWSCTPGNNGGIDAEQYTHGRTNFKIDDCCASSLPGDMYLSSCSYSDFEVLLCQRCKSAFSSDSLHLLPFILFYIVVNYYNKCF